MLSIVKLCPAQQNCCLRPCPPPAPPCPPCPASCPALPFGRGRAGQGGAGRGRAGQVGAGRGRAGQGGAGRGRGAQQVAEQLVDECWQVQAGRRANALPEGGIAKLCPTKKVVSGCDAYRR